MRPCSSPPERRHVRHTVRSSPLLAGLPDALVDAVVERLTWFFVPGREVVVEVGDSAEAVFVVLYGRVVVRADIDRDGRVTADETVDELGPGDMVGLIGAATGEAHAAQATAARDSELGRLAVDDLWSLAATYPGLAQRLAGQAVAQARHRLHRRLPTLTNLALVAGSADAPLAAFGRQLSEALGALEPVQYVTVARFDEAVGEGASLDDLEDWDATDRDILAWVAEQERNHRFILYVADDGPTAWTRRVERMADRVLVVARAGDDPDLYGAEHGVDWTHTELVLLHPDGAERPAHTLEWTGRRPGLRRVHHLREGRGDDLRRLARLLAGRPICLVLGGGGARGAAQIGAVAALRDAGVPIDAVGGTSAGAGIAAMVALGWDPETMARRNRHAFLTLAPFRKVALPFHSFLRKVGVEAAARYLFGDTRAEDLWIEWYGVCADLVRGERVVLRSGPLWQAVLASTALPGVLPPVVRRGQLLVDGGIFDNNPVREMASHHPGGVVLLVDVGRAEAAMVDPLLPELPSNLRAWWARLWPFGRRRRVPSLPEILVRTMTVSRDLVEIERLAHVYVRPAVDRFGLTQFVAQDALVVIGYNATLDVLDEVCADPELVAALGIDPDHVRGLPRRVLQSQARLADDVKPPSPTPDADP